MFAHFVPRQVMKRAKARGILMVDILSLLINIYIYIHFGSIAVALGNLLY